MDFQDWQKNWDELGKDDPLWVVLTDPAKKGGKWSPEEFFETGRIEVQAVRTHLQAIGVTHARGRALDFGCGVGRLTQALAPHFDRVDGVDISPSMLKHAGTFNRIPEKCFFHLNSRPDLSIFPDNTFDFVYSNIALQHIAPEFSKVYLREFVRVLKPNGIAVFQLLSATLARKLFPDGFVKWYRGKKFAGDAFIGMFGVPKGEIDAILHKAGGQTVNLRASQDNWRWKSWSYVVKKTP